MIEHGWGGKREGAGRPESERSEPLYQQGYQAGYKAGLRESIYISGMSDPQEWGEHCAKKNQTEETVIKGCLLAFHEKGGSLAKDLQEMEVFIQQALDAYRYTKESAK